MGIQFAQKTESQTTIPEVKNEIAEVKPYDIQSDRQTLNSQYVGSEEVDRLASQIDVFQLDSIVTFGADAAEDIARASDSVLNNTNMEQVNETSRLLTALSKIMEKFDPDEFKDDKGLSKIFGNAKKKLDKLLSKYHTMGDEIDVIYVELRKYEDEIKRSNQTLNEMFDSNVNYCHTLVKYILAGEQGCNEIREYIGQREAEFQKTGDNSIQFEIQNLNQALSMLEQRTQDLRIAENVAMQSVPMIKTMEYSNANLIRKINSAFIITLPVFKQALAQAVLLKRQKIQTEGMAELDRKTNEMLKKNAQNSVNQMKSIAQMTSNSSIKVETLEQTWSTIMNGIAETRQIQEEASRKREEDKVKLQRMKEEFNQKGL